MKLHLFLLVSLFALGAKGEWDSLEEEDYFFDEDYREPTELAEEQNDIIKELAVKHAPFLRFHKKEGTEDFCFPQDATEYYELRDSGDWSRQCNMNYSSTHDGNLPTYWHAKECDGHLHIAYWSFFGYNHNCDGVSGERDAWWEFLVVKIRNWETAPHMHEVMFGQKKGWYTRLPGRYEVSDESHPVVFVGRASHGFYHDAGGTNTCCYFEDTRNPGPPDLWMRTWLNLVELKKDGSGEAWMDDPGTDHWSGILSPTYRDNWNLCTMLGCKGSFIQVCSTCGCHKSDIGEHVF